MKFLILIAKIIIWVILMLAYLIFFTFSNDNTLSLQPDWFSGDKNQIANGTYSLVNYYSPGFPIQINGSSTEGLYWLAWTINIVFAVVIGVLLLFILRKLHFDKS